jgi:peroxiredoxin
MLINAPAPDFSLPDTTGQTHRLSDYLGRIVVVNFWSAECPWSERADKHLLALAERYQPDLVILPVSSNLNETSQLLAESLRLRGLDFVLVDGGSQLANAWQAQTTPHAFVVDRSGILRYQGAIDDVTFRKRNPEHFHVEQAVSALMSGRLPEIQETQPYGCTITRNI